MSDQTQDSQKALDTSADCSIDSVTKVGGAYLATSWFMFQEAVTRHDQKIAPPLLDHNVVYSFAMFGLLVQIAFGLVIHAQRNARCKALGIPAKGIIRDDKGDVVVVMLNCLLMVLWFTYLLFFLLLVASQMRGGSLHALQQL